MGELDQRILRLAVPNLLAAVSIPLIGIVDTALIGHLPQVAFLGAVATASVIFDVLFWGTGFLRMATTSIVSHHHGAGDDVSCAEALYRSLLTALVLAGLIVIARDGIAWLGFELAGGSDEVRLWGERYFHIRILGAPFVLCTLVLTGFFLGRADVLTPMAITMVTNVVNIAGDYALIYGKWGAPELGVEGAAWAAVAANGVGVGMGVTVLAIRYRARLRVRFGSLFDIARARHQARTNAALAARTLCLLFAQFSMMGMVARMGEIPLAAHAIVWQIWALVSFGVDGFAHAAETLVGNCLGSGDPAAARKLARRTLHWGVGIGGVLAVVYCLTLAEIAGLFTAHGEVITAVASLTLVVGLVQPLNAAVFIFDGIFIGANDVAYLFGAMAVAAFGVYLPAAGALVFWLDGGLVGAWLAYDGLMIGRFLTLFRRYRSDAWLVSFAR